MGAPADNDWRSAPCPDRPLDRAALGREAERLAAAHLEAAGASILLRNYRRRRGELDLVALHRGVLLIVEVRLRSNERHGGGAASVDAQKQRRLVHAARQLLQQRRDLARHPVRFDVIALSRRGAAAGPAASGVDAHAGDGASPWKIDWLQHAFEARG